MMPPHLQILLGMFWGKVVQWKEHRILSLQKLDLDPGTTSSFSSITLVKRLNLSFHVYKMAE